MTLQEAIAVLYRWHNTRDHMGRHLDPPAISEQVLGKLRDAGYTARSGAAACFASQHRVTRRGAIAAQRQLRGEPVGEIPLRHKRFSDYYKLRVVLEYIATKQRSHERRAVLSKHDLDAKQIGRWRRQLKLKGVVVP